MKLWLEVDNFGANLAWGAQLQGLIVESPDGEFREVPLASRSLLVITSIFTVPNGIKIGRPPVRDY